MLSNNVLSKREIECLVLAAKDFTTEETSRVLNRAENTIKKHRAMILRKLGCCTMAGAVMLGIHLRIIDHQHTTG